MVTEGPRNLYTARSKPTGMAQARMAKDDKNTADVAALTFEQALKQLEDIVQRLEKGQVDLEDSIAIYERGTALKAHCEAKLRDAEARIEKIVIGPGGAASTTPLDPN
jgi:exodeoxyribonuclease VII small subunit